MTEFNSEMKQRYELAIERIKDIKEELANEDILSVPLKEYFYKIHSFIMLLDDTKTLIESGKLGEMSGDELRKLNYKLYEDIIISGGVDNYKESFTCPDYAGYKFGNAFSEENAMTAAKLFSALFVLIRSAIQDVFSKDFFSVTCIFELFLEIYGIVKGSDSDEEMLRSVKSSMYYFAYDYAQEYMESSVEASMVEDDSFVFPIVMNSDLSDTDYLYLYGECIGDNEIKVSQYLASLDDDKIKSLAATFVDGYVEGFKYAGIDLSTKKTVNIRYNIGFERIVRQAVRQFENIGLKPIFYLHRRDYRKASPRKIGIVTCGPNSQYEYDHRYDLTYFMNKSLLDRYMVCTRIAFEKYKEEAAVYAGPACMEVFGEKPFIPRESKYAISADSKAMKLLTSYNQERSLLMDEFIDLSTTSFTIIAYPIPEIGEHFNEIFDETVRINTLDKGMYRQIQEKIIEVLNEGVGAHICGMNGNKTDLFVSFANLNDPQKETLFENCLADVNIPVGEVFTSPRLSGTNGTLNVSKVYLNELEYTDLTVEFKDGMIKEYDCSNFEDKEKCKKYIHENIMFGHDSLPMGEFAIGTNTSAYVMARKYDIADKMPILIAEKTGPHFAVGDTCYSMSEENRVYNPDGKEIIAKDNEVSILRKTDIEKAYFNCHTDITIPYDELGYIDVVKADNSTIRIIENGRFVLEGTEKLNEAFI